MAKNVNWDVDVPVQKKIFSLAISQSSAIPRDLPAKIKGKFEKRGDECFFRVETVSRTLQTELRCLKSDECRRIAPLILYLAEEKIPVVLSGVQMSNVYVVRNMEVAPQAEYLSKYSPSFVESVVRQLRDHSDTAGQSAMRPSLPFMRRKEEMEAYYEICKHTMPDWLSIAIQRELGHLKTNGTASDNYKHALLALQYLVNINWAKLKLAVPPVDKVREVLDEAFFGLTEVKTRIMEIIAQIRRTGELPKWGVLINGPAGSGKTSVAKAFAAILGMFTIYIDVSSLGDDPETLSGSSRIYSNGKPGIIWDKLFQARSGTGVLILNEIDKASGQGKDGKASSADVLLTLLDNQGFMDNYMELAIPTDSLFCVATCNEIEKLSAPLRDRFLVIDLPGYSPEEKAVIWTNYVVPQVLERLNIPRDQIGFTDEAVSLIVSEYAVAPGVRDLEQLAERFAGSYCIEADEEGDDYERLFSKDDVRDLLGPSKKVFRTFAVNPGEINAAFYHAGKAHFFLIEAVMTEGKGELRVLGPVPDLQKEYIQVAYECVRQTTSCDLSSKDITIFIPQPVPGGAENYIGCAAYAAICSKLLNTSLAIRDIAFVGGVDLNGNLYFDESDITPLLKSMKTMGITTLYAPFGTSAMIDPKVNSECNITVIEARDAKSLISLAVSRNHLCC